jgi:hypothetical protein
MTTLAVEKSVALPDPETVGRRAEEILCAVEACRDFERLRAATLAYPTCWATFTGYPIVAQWDLDTDGGPLFVEALRAMALKAAMFELTGSEAAAELDVSAPVDEMVHALTAQFTLLSRIQTRLGLTFVHATDRERFTYDVGGYTDLAYQAAGWGEPDRRYWIGLAETKRRLQVLFARYESIGVHGGGRSHDITFEAAA